MIEVIIIVLVAVGLAAISPWRLQFARAAGRIWHAINKIFTLWTEVNVGSSPVCSSGPKPMTSPSNGKKQIAVIGTEGAGKTVFLSVLAMRHRTPEAGRVWLEYKNRETQQRVTETWDILARQDWPPSTPAGTLSRLEWGFHTPDGTEHAVRICDPAGQDFRRIFEVEDGAAPLLPIQQQLSRMLDTAHVVLLLVNLREVIDAPSHAEIDNIEIPLKLALDRILRRSGSSAAIVLTQHDTFVDRLREMGLDVNDAMGAVRHFLPQVGGALALAPAGRVHVCFVAAVGETVSLMAEDGAFSRRPKAGFSSEGLSQLVAWMEDTLHSKSGLRRAFAWLPSKRGRSVPPTLGPDSAPRIRRPLLLWIISIGVLLICVTLSLFYLSVAILALSTNPQRIGISDVAGLAVIITFLGANIAGAISLLRLKKVAFRLFLSAACMGLAFYIIGNAIVHILFLSMWHDYGPLLIVAVNLMVTVYAERLARRGVLR